MHRDNGSDCSSTPTLGSSRRLLYYLIASSLPLGSPFATRRTHLHHRHHAFTTTTTTTARVSDGPEPPPSLTLSDVTFERFIAEQTYSVVASYAPGTAIDGAVPEGLQGLGKTPRLTTEGRSTCRLFRGQLTDVSIRSRGGDPRCVIREYAGSARVGKSARRAARDASLIADREVAVHALLLAEWTKPGGMGAVAGGFYAKLKNEPPPPPPFPVLLGTLTDSMAEVEGQLDEAQWRDNLSGAEP